DLPPLNVISEARLPKDISPLGYEINIKPNMENQTFKGCIEIHLKWNNDSKKVHLHAHESLFIHQRAIKLTQIRSKTKTAPENLTILRSSRLPRSGIFVLYLKETVERDSECRLKMSFEGNILKDPQGLFRGYYKNSFNGEEEIYLATNMKPNHARRLFPCFDEPGIKFPFTSRVHATLSTLLTYLIPLFHNLSVLPVPDFKDNFVDFFYDTGPMSAHSFSFVISKLHKSDEVYKSTPKNIPTINIWHNKIALEVLTDIQSKFHMAHERIRDFVNESLPFAKFEVIAIPDLPTYRYMSQYGMLIVRESELKKNEIFEIMRETMYQWIGVCITPYWWTEANINKALINFLASELVIEINGEAEFNGKYPMTILYSLYYELSKRYPNSRITGMKQELTSYKIELTIRMLKHVLGMESFKNGIRKFIAEYKNMSYKGPDLWNTLSKQAKTDKTLDNELSILEIAESWIKQTRLPVININRDYELRTATIQQKVYLRERPHDVPDQDKMLWWIPLLFIREDDLNIFDSSYLWIKKIKQMQIFDMPPQHQFIIVNPEEIGPFPVNYDEKNWNMLSNFLQTENGKKVIPVFTRAKLLHDAWNLAYAGDLNFETALNMTLFIRNERNHVVWNPVFTFIDQIGRRIEMSSVYKKFELYVIALLAPIYEDLGTPKYNEATWKQDFRKLSKTFLCRAGYLPCINAARKSFELWLNSSNPDFENPVLSEDICPVFKLGSMEEWRFGLERIRKFPKLRPQSDRTHLLKMLSRCPAQHEKIHYLLKIAILSNNSIFTESDQILIINAVASSFVGYTTLLNLVSDNWVYIRQK
ncbi:hypothetical protein KR032_009345, partial [Drosophila birchii]